MRQQDRYVPPSTFIVGTTAAAADRPFAWIRRSGLMPPSPRRACDSPSGSVAGANASSAGTRSRRL